jgi:RNA polymerase sigma-70 factor, ECF subfamily
MPEQVIQRQAFSLMTIEELVPLAQEGNRQALEALVKQVQKTVYITLFQLMPERPDVMDLTQEVLLRMCRSIHTLRNPRTFKYWLNRIITHLFYDELRRQQRRPAPLSLDAPIGEDSGSDMSAVTQDIADTAPRPEQVLLGNELDRQINKAIGQLQEPFRTTLVLREFQGLNYEEIASLTQVNLGTVKSRLARARGKLQELLTPYVRPLV